MEENPNFNERIATEISRPAPHGLRAAAWLIDSLIIMSVYAFLPQPLNYLLFISLFIVYHTVLIWLIQQTVGKALLGLRVERLGREPGFFWALGRSSLGYCIVNVLGTGVLLALFNRWHRCLHDYIFRSVVIFEGSGAIKANSLLTRLVRFAERQRKAVEEKKRTLAILAGLWGFLMGLGNGLKKAVELLTRLGSGTGAPAAAPSIAGALSLKTAALITVASATITGIVVTKVPVVRDAAQWLIRPRYVLTHPPNLLVNGDFEDGPDPAGYSVLQSGSTTIAGWTVTRATIDYIGTHFQCSKSKRCVDLDGTPGYGGIKQTFATKPGQIYRVTFDLSGNYEGPPAVKKIRVTAAGQTFETDFDTTEKGSKVVWESRTWAFKAVGPSTTIEFHSLDTEGRLFGPLIDNVTVTLSGGKRGG